MNAISAMPAALRPIRVLHLRDSAWIDGPGRTILESGGHYDPARIDFHIGVLVPDANVEHPMLEAARQRGLQAHRIVDRGGLDLEVGRQIARLVEELRIDVLHTSDIRTNLIAFLCRLPARIRRVATAHGWIANTLRRRVLRLIDKAVLGRCDAVIFVSAATRNLVPRWWLPDGRAHVVHNAVPATRAGAGAPDSARRSGADNAGWNLVNVGRFSPEKGHELLLDAFASVLREYPQLRLQLAGSGPLEAGLRAQAERLGITQCVSFLGFVKDMHPVYAASDLVVQSSFTEGMPNVILEAALAGVPVVATAVGGTGEIIEHGRSGWLIEAGSRDAIAQAIRHFVKNRALFREMTTRARAHVEARHTFAARTQRMTEIYESLPGGRR